MPQVRKHTSAHSPVRRRVPDWDVLRLPGFVRAYVIGLPVLAVVLAGWLATTTTTGRRDVLLAGLLLSAGALSVEVTRRVGQPSGTMARDLLSAWWLPMAVLLPPVYVLLAPVPLLAMTQWRVHRGAVHRRVFSAASIGLAYATASTAFHAAFPDQAFAVTGPTPTWALGVAAVGVLGAAINDVLIAAAVKTADPQTRWRELLWEAENLRLEAVEACLGVTVALLMGLSPVLLVFMLPPVLLLQRGLLHAQLRAVALQDPKTGLLNATTWEREAAGKLSALRRRSLPTAVLLVDVDHFKRVNDTYGHLVGDQVLVAVAGALRQGVRDGDLLGRFGGEEFVALLAGADAAEAARVAERLREQVAHLVVLVDGGVEVQVTVSIGVIVDGACESSVPVLLASADYAMYRAKAAGRNTVVLTGDEGRAARPSRRARGTADAPVPTAEP